MINTKHLKILTGILKAFELRKSKINYPLVFYNLAQKFKTKIKNVSLASSKSMNLISILNDFLNTINIRRSKLH